MTEFPVLDASRLYATNVFGRTIFDTFGHIEAYIEELDSWVAMPLRLVHDQANDWHLEAGPYSLDRADIECLRAAIGAYDAAIGKTS